MFFTKGTSLPSSHPSPVVNMEPKEIKLEGGRRDLVELTREPLDVGAISASVTHPSTGATSLFVGTTRDNFEGKHVVRLEYEAYESMARKQLAALCTELRIKWTEIHSIAIHHRLGLVEAEQASVVIAISSPHRKDALQVGPVSLSIYPPLIALGSALIPPYSQAVEHCIERLKATAPIWKKEVYSEGAGQWKANKECQWAPTAPQGS